MQTYRAIHNGFHGTVVYANSSGDANRTNYRWHFVRGFVRFGARLPLEAEVISAEQAEAARAAYSKAYPV